MSLAQRNLDLLVSMMKRPHDDASHYLWNCLEVFLERTSEDVYVVLNRLLLDMEFVMSVDFEELGGPSLISLFTHTHLQTHTLLHILLS